jgi:prepilin-type N-terminal cleavage/methylation domain-containing protein
MRRQDSKQRRPNGSRPPRRDSGFTMPELLIGVLVAVVLTALAVPMYNTAMTTMRLNSMVGAITGALSQTRYQAVMNSKTYTLVLTVPANSYVVTDVTDNVAGSAVPLPSSLVAVNGGTAATDTFTFNPNGTVTGAAGGAIPALVLTYLGRQTNISVSGVGNVSSKIIH